VSSFNKGAGDNVLARHRRAASTLRAKLDQAAGLIADALVNPAANPLQAVAKSLRGHQ